MKKRIFIFALFLFLTNRIDPIDFSNIFNTSTSENEQFKRFAEKNEYKAHKKLKNVYLKSWKQKFSKQYYFEDKEITFKNIIILQNNIKSKDFIECLRDRNQNDTTQKQHCVKYLDEKYLDLIKHYVSKSIFLCDIELRRTTKDNIDFLSIYLFSNLTNNKK